MTKRKKHSSESSFHLPKPLNKAQEKLLRSILTHEMSIVFGSAGTGKTFLTAACAAYYYSKGDISKIILTRPTVPISRTIGHLPGTLEEKMAPWAAPFIVTVQDFLGKGAVECMVKNGNIEIVPFELIRGRSWSESFIVLDEAQNATVEEIHAFVTRIGSDSKTVINGDLEQVDLHHQTSGLEHLLYLLGDINNEELANKVGIVEMGSDSIVRSELCRLWVKAFAEDSR